MRGIRHNTEQRNLRDGIRRRGNEPVLEMDNVCTKCGKVIAVSQYSLSGGIPTGGESVYATDAPSTCTH